MDKNRILMYIALTLTGLAWLKTGWQLATKLPPPKRIRYNTAGNWKDNGYPHDKGPRIIAGSNIWTWSMYGKDYRGKRNGFIRYNPENGTADMLWPFPGNSRYARIIAFARHATGKIAVLWNPHLTKKTRLDILNPEGGLRPLGNLPKRRNNLKPLGMFWTGGHPTVALGHYLQRKTFLYTPKKNGSWKERIINWPGNYPHRTMPHLAKFKNGRWTTIFSDWILKKPDRPEPINIYSFTEGETKATTLGRATAASRDTFHLIDGSPGNLTGGFHYFRKQHHFLRGNSLTRFAKPDKKSGKMLETLRDTLLISSSGNLSRLIYIREKYKTGMEISCGKKSISFRYSRDTGARRKRKAMFISIIGRENPKPACESFRFAGSMIIPAPASNGSVWLLGTFGYCIKVDKNGNRIDSPDPFSRFFRLFRSFSGRSSAYDDFYNESEVLKISALLFPLFGLPLLLLIIAIHKKTYGHDTAKLRTLKRQLLSTHILLFCASAWWFWRIITEI